MVKELRPEDMGFEAHLSLVAILLQRREDRLPIQLLRIVEQRFALDLHVAEPLLISKILFIGYLWFVNESLIL